MPLSKASFLGTNWVLAIPSFKLIMVACMEHRGGESECRENTSSCSTINQDETNSRNTLLFVYLTMQMLQQMTPWIQLQEQRFSMLKRCSSILLQVNHQNLFLPKGSKLQ